MHPAESELKPQTPPRVFSCAPFPRFQAEANPGIDFSDFRYLPHSALQDSTFQCLFGGHHKGGLVMDGTVDSQITDCFKSGRQNVQDLIAPLIELASQSSSLLVGYGTPQAGVRSEMIPYFHVCGTPADKEPIRVLVIGGWVGTEIITPYAIARLLVALESRLRLATGIEITAYPVANLEAHRRRFPHQQTAERRNAMLGKFAMRSRSGSRAGIGAICIRRDFSFASKPARAGR